MGEKVVGQEVREVGGDRGSHRTVYGLEGQSIKCRFHPKYNGKTQEGSE